MNTINGNFLERTIPNLKGALVTLNMGNSTSEMNLEDLATTLGVGSGGGGTNPTSTYVPFNNGGTFADSYLINNTALLKTNFEETDKGIFLDFANNIYAFGNSAYETSLSFTDNQFNLSNRLKIDFTNNNVLYIGDINSSYTQTAFTVNPANSSISTSDNLQNKGLLIDFSSQLYALGNPEGGSWGNVNNSDGLMINFSNETISLGYNFSAGVTLYMDNSNETIKTYMGGSNTGLSLDFLNKLYSFGQLNGGNSTKLEIDDNNQKLILSSNLETNSAGDAVEKWLKVTIGTTDYLIALLNPPL